MPEKHNAPHVEPLPVCTLQFTTLLGAIETLRQDNVREMSEIKEWVNEIHKATIKGNGKPSLVVQIDRNTQFRRFMTRFLWWAITPLYGGLIGMILLEVLKKGG